MECKGVVVLDASPRETLIVNGISRIVASAAPQDDKSAHLPGRLTGTGIITTPMNMIMARVILEGCNSRISSEGGKESRGFMELSRSLFVLIRRRQF